MYSKNDVIGAVGILLITFTIFRVSPIHTIFDSRYAMLFSQHLLWNHSFSLEAQAFPEFQSRQPGQLRQRGLDFPYQLVQADERFYYWYPSGNIILSMPFVALANAMDISAIDQNGIYDARGDSRIQNRLAALLMAALSVIVFLTSRLILSFRWSLLITAATAFGTQVWSTASRAMWLQTWEIFILGFVIWLIVRTDVCSMTLNGIGAVSDRVWRWNVLPTNIDQDVKRVWDPV